MKTGKDERIYSLKSPDPKKLRPILISVPHAGVKIPASMQGSFLPEVVTNPRDTDWLVDECFEYAGDIGATLICAQFSRYVVDLNRNPDGTALYNDGRVLTGFVPLSGFDGVSLYRNACEPDAAEIQRRRDMYFDPYHFKIREILNGFVARFGYALLYDAHSIGRHVPALSQEPLPDLMLGTNKGLSTTASLQNRAVEALETSGFSFSVNHPFSGGYITRCFGNPAAGIHAFQLERSQDIYLSSRAGEARLSAKKVTIMQNFEKGLISTLDCALGYSD